MQNDFEENEKSCLKLVQEMIMEKELVLQSQSELDTIENLVARWRNRNFSLGGQGYKYHLEEW